MRSILLKNLSVILINNTNYFPNYSLCRKSDTGLQEWGIVELQGDLEVRGDEMMENQFIGDLNYDKYGQPVSVYLFINN